MLFGFSPECCSASPEYARRHYGVVSLLGKGGRGEVWKAHDPRVGRDVAIKVSAAQFSERFEREAKSHRRADPKKRRACRERALTVVVNWTAALKKNWR
jgi:serine/threonine protein kinase